MQIACWVLFVGAFGGWLLIAPASVTYQSFILRYRRTVSVPDQRVYFQAAGRSIAAAGDSLSFASPKEGKPREGDPAV
jgi:hypothetical protein